MNTCATCKHYHPHDSNGLGQCHRWHGGDGSGGYDNDTVVKPNEVIVETDEGWGAFMGPQFGCVLWELSEPANVSGAVTGAVRKDESGER